MASTCAVIGSVEAQSVSGAPLWTARTAWTLSAKPTLLIGGGEEETPTAFSSIYSLITQPNGEIYLIDTDTYSLRRFSATGAFLGTAMRRGNGPGEGQGPMLIGRFGSDSLVVRDMGLARISAFTLAPKYARSFSIAEPKNGRIVEPIAVLADKRIVATRRSLGDIGNVQRGDTIHVDVLLLSADGDRVDSLTKLPSELASPGQLGRYTTLGRVAFGWSLQIATDGQRLFMGTGADGSIGVYDLTGKRLGLFGRPYVPRPVTKAENARRIDRSVERGAVRSYMEREAVAELHPAYTKIQVDPSGNVWVRTESGYDIAERWSVFDTALRWLGDIRMPPRFRMMAPERESVIGVLRDEDDVESIARYALMRP